MHQRRWRRFAFAAPVMLALILGSSVAWAQTDDQETVEEAVDLATIDELRRTLAAQQRQIDNQQRQLEFQATTLNNLQQQIESVRQSAPSETSPQAVFRSVLRDRARAQDEGRLSGTRPNRLGRMVIHRAGRAGRTGL